jgi:hypothetical protein
MIQALAASPVRRGQTERCPSVVAERHGQKVPGIYSQASVSASSSFPFSLGPVSRVVDLGKSPP